jgi:glycosyltransferase involved in cell wall biosynthesis
MLDRLDQVLYAIDNHYEFSIFLIIDGDDGTFEEVKKFSARKIEVILNEKNAGKGFSLRKGFEVTKTEFVVFFDADLDIHPGVIGQQLQILVNDNSLAGVVAAKNLPGSMVDYPTQRRILSYLFRKLVNFYFKVDIADSQTGAKSFRRQVISSEVLISLENGFLFDLELMIRILKAGKGIAYCPVQIEHRFDSTITLKSILDMVIDLIKLQRKIRLLS